MPSSLPRLAACVALAALAFAPAAAARPGLVVGISDDAPKWLGDEAAAPIAALGARTVRLTVTWEPGMRTLDGTRRGELELGTSSAEARGLRVVLAVFGGRGMDAPTDASARADYCAFVGSALELAPSVRDVVIWNEPNSRRFWRPQYDEEGGSVAPAAYAALLARCYDVLHELRPGLNVVGLATAPRGDDIRSHSPGAFIRGVGDAYRASFRMRPLFDTVSHHVYGDESGERPWRRHPDSTTIAQGDWNKLMWSLAEAFDHTAQPLPGECGDGRCVSIWYLEAGFETDVPELPAERYLGREVATGVLPAWAGGPLADADRAAETLAPDQATQLVDAVRLAYCQPHVAVLHDFLAFDEARLPGWQSGVLYADWTGKPSLFAFLDVVAEAHAGHVDCDALPGGRPSPDFVPPPAPSRPGAELYAAPFEVRLTWAAVDDAAAYRVYRDGSYVGSSGEPSFGAPAEPGAEHAYAVAAEDGAGNVSPRSPDVRVAVPDP